MADSRTGRPLARAKNEDGWLATSPPTLIADRLLFHDHAGRLWAVDAETLNVAWATERPGMISYAPPVAAEEVLVTQWIGSGLVLARTSVGEEILYAPAMTDRGLFLVSKGGTIWRVRSSA
ncbi:MAG: hypothetical protein GY722_27740 [bacterium]|nr:hypothetical protein [bacterium]